MYEYRFLMMSKYNQTRLLQETFKVKQTTLKESHWLIRFYLKQIVSKRSMALVIDYQVLQSITRDKIANGFSKEF